jgi:hypothetical protein
LFTVVPFLLVFLVERPTPTARQVSGGGPPPHFNKLGDNLPRAVTVEVGGAEILVGAIEDLIVSKELLGRDKDRDQLPELRRLWLARDASAAPEARPEHDVARDGPEPPGLEL